MQPHRLHNAHNATIAYGDYGEKMGSSPVQATF